MDVTATYSRRSNLQPFSRYGLVTYCDTTAVERSLGRGPLRDLAVSPPLPPPPPLDRPWSARDTGPGPVPRKSVTKMPLPCADAAGFTIHAWSYTARATENGRTRYITCVRSHAAARATRGKCDAAVASSRHVVHGEVRTAAAGDSRYAANAVWSRGSMKDTGKKEKCRSPRSCFIRPMFRASVSFRVSSKERGN